MTFLWVVTPKQIYLNWTEVGSGPTLRLRCKSRLNERQKSTMDAKRDYVMSGEIISRMEKNTYWNGTSFRLGVNLIIEMETSIRYLGFIERLFINLFLTALKTGTVLAGFMKISDSEEGFVYYQNSSQKILDRKAVKASAFNWPSRSCA